MKCTACQRENDTADKFCSECGAPLLAKCANCSAVLKSGAKFCSECGTSTTTSTPAAAPAEHRAADYTPPHLAERIRSEQAAMETRGATYGERKTITALFADLKGSTALIIHLVENHRWLQATIPTIDAHLSVTIPGNDIAVGFFSSQWPRDFGFRHRHGQAPWDPHLGGPRSGRDATDSSGHAASHHRARQPSNLS